MKKEIVKIADETMDKIADILCWKTTFLIFCIIAFVPLIYELPNNILEWQKWASQTTIQLTALSVIAYNTKKESRILMKMLKETHDAVMKEMKKLDKLIELLNNLRK